VLPVDVVLVLGSLVLKGVLVVVGKAEDVLLGLIEPVLVQDLYVVIVILGLPDSLGDPLIVLEGAIDFVTLAQAVCVFEGRIDPVFDGVLVVVFEVLTLPVDVFVDAIVLETLADCVEVREDAIVCVDAGEDVDVFEATVVRVYGMVGSMVTVGIGLLVAQRVGCGLNDLRADLVDVFDAVADVLMRASTFASLLIDPSVSIVAVLGLVIVIIKDDRIKMRSFISNSSIIIPKASLP